MSRIVHVERTTSESGNASGEAKGKLAGNILKGGRGE